MERSNTGENSAEQRLAVAWGFAEVLPDKVTILAETAERPSEIDVDRARKAKVRAEQRLASGDHCTSMSSARSMPCIALSRGWMSPRKK